MQVPRVSVILPTYNCAPALRAAIQSVLAQDMADFELIVVGDGCTDDSAQVVRSFTDDRVCWVALPSNSGTPSAPRNVGLARARGEHIAYLGHDDLWFPWHLSTLLAAAPEGVDFVHSLGLSCGPSPSGPTPRFAFSLPPAAGITGGLVSPSNWLVTRHFSAQVGDWSATLTSGVDKDWLHRAFDLPMRSKHAPRLSVLRFPSSEWTPYQRPAPFPQPDVLRQLLDAPAVLELQLLTALGQHLALQPHLPAVQQVRRSDLDTALLHFRAALMNVYGRERWPLRQLIRRHEDRQSRLARGLPPERPGR